MIKNIFTLLVFYTIFMAISCTQPATKRSSITITLSANGGRRRSHMMENIVNKSREEHHHYRHHKLQRPILISERYGRHREYAWSRETKGPSGSFGRYGRNGIYGSKERHGKDWVYGNSDHHSDNEVHGARRPSGSSNVFYRDPDRSEGRNIYGSGERYGNKGVHGVSGRYGSNEVHYTKGGSRSRSIHGSSSSHTDDESPGARRPSRNNVYEGTGHHGGIEISGTKGPCRNSIICGGSRDRGDNEIPGTRGPFGSKNVPGGFGRPDGNKIYGSGERYGSRGTNSGKGRRESDEHYGSRHVDGDFKATSSGCDVGSGKYVGFGETYRKGNFIVLCEKLNSTATRLIPIKCLLDGIEMHVGQKKRKDGFGYACQKTEKGITLDIIGCFGDEDAFAEFGETFPKNNFIYMCVKDGSLVLHKAYGCIIQGKQVKLSQTVPVGNYLYKCYSTRDGGIRTEVVACLDKSGSERDIGEVYQDGSFLYKCKRTESGATAVLAGCIAKVSGREEKFKFGESWNPDPRSQLSYELQCVGNETIAMTEVTHCVANLDWAKSTVPVGSTVELPKNMVFLCRKQRDGKVIGQIMSCDEYEKKEAKYDFCERPAAKPSPSYRKF